MTRCAAGNVAYSCWVTSQLTPMAPSQRLSDLADGTEPVPSGYLGQRVDDITVFLFTEITRAVRARRGGEDTTAVVAQIRAASEHLHPNLGDQVRTRLDRRSWTPRRPRSR